MGLKEHDIESRSWGDLIIMILCVFVMVLLLLMTSSSFTPDFHEVHQAIRRSGMLVMSEIWFLQGHFL